MQAEKETVIAVLKATALGPMHDAALVSWYEQAPDSVDEPTDLTSIILAQHFSNFRLWALEDEARRDDVDDGYIAGIKRQIDPWNQRRNDLMERIDEVILGRFEDVDLSKATLHSETAGMIVDRLSILSLKTRNMGVYAARGDDPSHKQECLDKQARLKVQRADLLACLEILLDEFRQGTRYFKSYKQFKAYNDPRLNPAVRKSPTKTV